MNQDFATIIIIDDVPIEACIIEDMLTDAGYKNVRSYSNPIIALKDIKARSAPALLIADYHMPEMNGVDVIEYVRRSCGRVQAILITGDEQKVKQLSPSYMILQKNITFYDRLKESVAQIINEQVLR